MTFEFMLVNKDYQLLQPNELFIHKGLIGYIRLIPSGYYVGYVGVPCSHKRYDEIVFAENSFDLDDTFSVHGGLTYLNNYAPGIDIELFPNHIWIGFDCNHAFDGRYIMDAHAHMVHSRNNVRDYEYVHKQVIHLINQISEDK